MNNTNNSLEGDWTEHYGADGPPERVITSSGIDIQKLSQA